jgi:hypothetical protein
MKTYYLLALSLLLTIDASSQTKIGLKGGVNFAKFRYSDSESNDDNKIQTSFQIGGYANLPLGKFFSFQPGLTLSGKGNKVESSFGYSHFKSSTNIMYLEIPVNAVYKKAGFYIGAGPYAAFALAGEHESEGEMDVSSSFTPQLIEFSDTHDLKFGSGDDKDFKRTDFGVNLLGGYEFRNGLNFGLNYGLGIRDIGSSSLDGISKTRNRIFSLTFGYSF